MVAYVEMIFVWIGESELHALLGRYTCETQADSHDFCDAISALYCRIPLLPE